MLTQTGKYGAVKKIKWHKRHKVIKSPFSILFNNILTTHKTVVLENISRRGVRGRNYNAGLKLKLKGG